MTPSVFSSMLVLALGAAAPDFDAALDAAAALEARGAYDAARRQLAALVPHADPTLEADLALRLCALWRREGEHALARQCYLEVARTHDDPAALARARYAAAAAAVALGDEGRGREELTELVHDLPYTEGARRALVLARGLHRDGGGAAQEADFLLGVASRLAWAGEPGAHPGPWARALLAETLVEIGRIRLAERDDVAGALRVLERAQQVARGTTWEDDAQVWSARALRRVGRRGEALVLYRELIEAQQASWFIGQYVSEYFDDALFEVGLVLEEQQLPAAAQAAYGELCRRAPTSVFVDDAAYRVALLEARQQQDTAPLRAFARAHPTSRHARAWRGGGAAGP